MVWLSRIRGAVGEVVPLIIYQLSTAVHNETIHIPDTEELQIKS